MDVSQFVIALFEQGRVALPVLSANSAVRPIAAEEMLRTRNALVDLERIERADFPGVAPSFAIDAAVWATIALCRACQFVLSRDLPTEEIEAALRQPPAPAATPSTVYSVDLAFRFLPDVYRLAKGASPDDPLTAQVARWAIDWPYSSVGLSLDTLRAATAEIQVGPQPPSIHLTPILAHDGLRRSYVDRIIATGDRSRLGDPRVAQAVHAAIGAYENLAPAVTKKLEHS